jgi:Glycoside hydrolase family 44
VSPFSWAGLALPLLLHPAPGVSGELLFSQRSGLGPGWKDLGWAPARRVEAGAPVSLDLSNNGGWIVSRPDLTGTFAALAFRMKAPEDWGSFLEVRVDSRRAETFPRVRITPQYQARLGDGWVQVNVPFTALDPTSAPFDQVVFRAAEKVGTTPVLLDEILLLAGAQAAQPVGPPQGEAQRTAQVAVDCKSPGRPISPLIYGIVYPGQRAGQRPSPWESGTTARAWGGSGASRFNWELGNAWNAGSENFFRNVAVRREGAAFTAFLAENQAHGAETVLTVPTLGWVARDTTSYAFPVSVFGKQLAVAPDNADIGNGVRPDGQPIPPGPAARTSVPAPPAFVGRWVRALAEKGATARRAIRMYVLDHEPNLWNDIHRDVHPNPVSYDELLDRTVTYAREIRRNDPEAVIAAPAEGSWPGFFFSAADLEGRVDRSAHGNLPLLPWWLREVNKAERRLGTRLVDVLDIHWFPQFEGAGVGTQAATDAATAARRIRSVRSLWDPSYVDESWIDDKVELIPRLRRWISENHPDGEMGIAFGEWGFGAEDDMSGGLAAAAALGVFAREGVVAAFSAVVPPTESPSFWAFRAYRNFDGRGGRFEELSSAAQVRGTLVEAFASRSNSGERLVIVLLNEDPANAVDAALDVSSCGAVRERHLFSFQGKPSGFDEVRTAATVPFQLQLSPYSINVVELQVTPPR